MDIERLVILTFVGAVISLALSLAISAIRASRRRSLYLPDTHPTWEDDPRYPGWRRK